MRFSPFIFVHILFVIFSLSLPLSSYAKAGCCSKHGGVAGCNQATGFQLCKDGTTSPTCKCDGTTVKMKSVKVIKKTQTETPEATTTTTEAVTIKAPKGCCSRHGGVAKCDKTTGYYVCKDGTQSTTCKCK